VNMGMDDYQLGLHYFGMDLPNLVLQWQSDYGKISENRPIDVVWEEEAPKDEFLACRIDIEVRGWQITRC